MEILLSVMLRRKCEGKEKPVIHAGRRRQDGDGRGKGKGQKNEEEDHERNWDWVRWTRKTKGENAKAGERWGRIRRRG